MILIEKLEDRPPSYLVAVRTVEACMAARDILLQEWMET
jgi:hypothetical protein